MKRAFRNFVQAVKARSCDVAHHANALTASATYAFGVYRPVIARYESGIQFPSATVPGSFGPRRDRKCIAGWARRQLGRVQRHFTYPAGAFDEPAEFVLCLLRRAEQVSRQQGYRAIQWTSDHIAAPAGG